MRAVTKGAAAVLVSYAICTVRGFAPLPANQFVSEAEQRQEPIVVRLHNDDVHTYDQVIAALRAFGLTPAASQQVTVKVDKEGEAVVATESAHLSAGLAKLRSAHQHFDVNAGLLVSMVPQGVVQMESRIAAIFDWFQYMGGLSEGLRRIIVEELFAALTSRAHIFQEPEEPSSSIEAMNVHYSAAHAFDNAQQFPSLLQHLSTLPARMPLVAPVYVDAAGHASHDSAGPGTSAPQARLEYATDFIERLRTPFNRCHRDAMGLLLMASPYLSTTIKKAIMDLVIQFQHDSVFKASFSQQITTLYPPLCVLYCRNVGTADRTVFHTTVQVYTANSVITMLSSDGVKNHLRLLPEGDHPLMIMPLLAATLQMVLLDVGCPPQGSSAAVVASSCATFLTHHAVRTHRLSHLCRDLEYLTADPAFCTRLIAEDVERGLVRRTAAQLFTQ